MRKLTVLAALVLALVAAPAAFGQQIAGTPHDLSGAGYGTTQICIFCHAPHNAIVPMLAPLWNHTSTAATYTVYAGIGTLNATPGQPTGPSRACLSCHDGSVAIDAYQGHTGTVNMTGPALLGTDLSNDHPISFAYNTALATADGGLVAPAVNSVGTAPALPLFTSGGTSGMLECATCHQVHSNQFVPFLRMSNGASALCLKCHIK